MRAAVLLIAAVVLLGACKKGKDDPFLSLRSRSKRLQQEWVLKDMSYVYKNESNGNTFISQEDYDGTTLTTVHTQNGNSVTYTNAVEILLDIRKGGTYAFTAVSEDGTQSSEVLWHWVDSDRKKTALWLLDFPYTYLDEPMVVDRLTSKELVLSGDFVNDQQTFRTTVQVTMAFGRKD